MITQIQQKRSKLSQTQIDALQLKGKQLEQRIEGQKIANVKGGTKALLSK